MTIPSPSHDKRVVSSGMFKLSLNSIAPGVFSSERLVAFQDATGETHYALVDVSFVNEGMQPWLEVRGNIEGGTALIALPNDGTRVRVPSTEVQALT
jgi:ABC-type taurine transport system ATPase subunit